MFKFFLSHTIFFLPQNQEKLSNIWLKQTFQKANIYFKTSKQRLFGRNLGCYLHYSQYQMGCYACIFKFPNTKIRENVPCVTFIWCTKYQHSTVKRAEGKLSSKSNLYFPIISMELNISWSKRSIFHVSITCSIFDCVLIKNISWQN